MSKNETDDLKYVVPSSLRNQTESRQTDIPVVISHTDRHTGSLNIYRLGLRYHSSRHLAKWLS